MGGKRARALSPPLLDAASAGDRAFDDGWAKVDCPDEPGNDDDQMRVKLALSGKKPNSLTLSYLRV